MIFPKVWSRSEVGKGPNSTWSCTSTIPTGQISKCHLQDTYIWIRKSTEHMSHPRLKLRSFAKEDTVYLEGTGRQWGTCQVPGQYPRP